jgi:hypothetical protein
MIGAQRLRGALHGGHNPLTYHPAVTRRLARPRSEAQSGNVLYVSGLP